MVNWRFNTMEEAQTWEAGFVPLTMGEKVIGRIKFDPDTGDISGKLTDPVLIPMLTELFVDGILETSFYGKAALPFDASRRLLDNFMKVDSSNVEADPAIEPEVTEEDLHTRRLKACVDAWPAAYSGEYNPSCCRFPKSCSPHGYIEAVQAGVLTEKDLEPKRGY